MLIGIVFIKLKKLEIGYLKLDLGICVLFYDINFFINIVVYKESLLDLISLE